MNTQKLLLCALTVGAVPVVAQADGSASMKITANIPVRCDASILATEVSGNVLTVTIRRECNTAHSILIGSSANDPISGLTITEASSGRTVRGPFGSFSQPERFVQGTEIYTITGNPQTGSSLNPYEKSLQVNIHTN